MTDTNKPVVLITGSSRGIGREIAIRLAKEGFRIVLNGVSPLDLNNLEKGAAEVKQTIEAAGGEAAFFRADVSCADDRAAMIEFIEKTFGRIDLLVNNAGIEPPFGDILESSEDRYDHVMATNLKGPYFLTQQVAKRMIAWQAQGVVSKARICFITSVQAYVLTHGGEYCMTKAALSMASRLFANRLGEYDIPVIEIAPGVFHSDMTAPHEDDIDRMIEAGRLITSRWGRCEEVGALVAAFARGDLDYSTGAQIEVGGGLGIRRL